MFRLKILPLSTIILNCKTKECHIILILTQTCRMFLDRELMPSLFGIFLCISCLGFSCVSFFCDARYYNCPFATINGPIKQFNIYPCCQDTPLDKWVMSEAFIKLSILNFRLLIENLCRKFCLGKMCSALKTVFC